MTVAELIKKLQKMPQNEKVFLKDIEDGNLEINMVERKEIKYYCYHPRTLIGVFLDCDASR